MTTYKLKLVERSRIIDQIEIETNKLGHFTSMVEVWEKVEAHAKQMRRTLQQQLQASSAEDKRKFAKMANIKKAMQPIMAVGPLDKLMNRLERYSYAHPVWAPFTTSKEREHVSHGNEKRQAKRKDPAQADSPAGS